MDYTSKLLTWQNVNKEYFTALKAYTNHEIVIVVNE